MTGPLAQQFSQAADAMTCHATPIMSGGLIGGMTHDPALCSGCRGRAALSVIERHVQDMETALRGLLVETEPEQHRGTEPHPERGACVWCDARAALPAREKGTE